MSLNKKIQVLCFFKKIQEEQLVISAYPQLSDIPCNEIEILKNPYKRLSLPKHPHCFVIDDFLNDDLFSTTVDFRDFYIMMSFSYKKGKMKVTCINFNFSKKPTRHIFELSIDKLLSLDTNDNFKKSIIDFIDLFSCHG